MATAIEYGIVGVLLAGGVIWATNSCSPAIMNNNQSAINNTTDMESYGPPPFQLIRKSSPGDYLDSFDLWIDVDTGCEYIEGRDGSLVLRENVNGCSIKTSLPDKEGEKK